MAVSMRGKKIDMMRLAAQNPDQMALSGLPKGRDDKTFRPSMNARGDILDQKGNVSIPREQIARDYHKSNPKAIKPVALRDINKEIFLSDTPAQAVAKQREATRKQRKLVDGE